MTGSNSITPPSLQKVVCSSVGTSIRLALWRKLHEDFTEELYMKFPSWRSPSERVIWRILHEVFQQTCVHEITSWSVMNKTGFAIRGRAWWTAAPLKPRTTIDTRGGQRWSKVKRCERKILCIVQARHCAVVDCCFLVEFVSQCKVSAHHASPYRMVSYTPLQLHYVMIATSSSRHNIKQSCLVWQRICSHCIRHHLKPITNHQSGWRF
jgi:hypothetical protein